MSNDMIFLVELILIFGAIMAFGVWELIKLHREEKKDDQNPS
ncbi:hypothetical protein [Alkalicaulis satelles]|nr:hypothetical protein [Alkalicaulis satelles]